MLRYLVALLGAITILVPSSMAAKMLAAGTPLEARLLVPTGSRISHPGDQIEATVIAPVFADGQLLIPQGAIVSGVVASVERLGLGLRHLTSSIEYRFDTLHLRDGDAIPIEARVVQIETAKERVNGHGMIGGIYPMANLSSNIAFYTLPLLWMDPELGIPMWGIKFVTARSPDPEIYFPAGTELVLQFTTEADIPGPAAPPDAIAPLSAANMADVRRIVAKFPLRRTDRGRHQPSDLVNLLLLGSRDSIDRAFQAAGWSGAQRNSLRSIYRMYHCMVQRMGYRMAPMDKLTLNGATADADYQKSLDTFSKRHHVRLWKQGQENAWLSAASEDVGYKLRRMHLTHATDPFIDNERAKVLNDLMFTGCMSAATLLARDSFDGTDQMSSMQTDGRIAVLRMNDCREPRTMSSESTNAETRGRRRSLEVLLALRNDVIRTNPISLAYNTIQALQKHERSQANGSLSAFHSNPRKVDSSEGAMQPKWIRPSVLDAISTQPEGAKAR